MRCLWCDDSLNVFLELGKTVGIGRVCVHTVVAEAVHEDDFSFGFTFGL